MRLPDAILKRRVIVCAGPGGVGKTTVSAAIAMGAAAAGRKTLVVTVDPARRLASALGVSALDNDERRIPDEELRRAGIEPRAPLFAMMLNMKRTWDELVERIAPDADARDRIMGNRFYEHLSSSMAGSHEYMAMEKLYELHHDRDYDLIVLDTPPTQNALDFLDAPTRMADAMDNESVARLLRPYAQMGKAGAGVVSKGAGRVLKIIGKITGAEMLTELAGFLASLQGTYDGFKDRAMRVRELLGSERSAFALVTATGALQVEEVVRFRERLEEHYMPFSGFVVNRVREVEPALLTLDAPEAPPASLNERFGDRPELAPLWSRLRDGLSHAQVEARRDAAVLERLESLAGADASCIRVPVYDEGVQSMEGLAHLVEHLLGSQVPA